MMHDVFFDCDSTLSAIEGIDELARMKGMADEVAAMTDAAMNGQIPLQAVYGKRLTLIQPTRADLQRVARMYQDAVVPHAREVIGKLHARGAHVFIISGGLFDAVAPFGEWLGVPRERIHAVELIYQANGIYKDYVHGLLTTQNGKAELIGKLRQAGRRATLIGDGSSDLAAAGAVDTFIGFGGVVAREGVRARSPIFISDNSLLPVLTYVR